MFNFRSRANRLTFISWTIAAASLFPAHGSSQTQAGLPQVPPNQVESSSTAAKGPSPNQTYIDYPTQKLIATVPALNGLKPDSDQSNLSSILPNIGRSIAESSLKMPNLISREDLYFLKDEPETPTPLTARVSMPDPEIRLRRSDDTEFNYLILPHPAPDGTTTIDEYRTDLKQHPAGPSAQASTVRGYGFTNQWLLFSSANQPDFQFRYLGQQKMDGIQTFVVAFAQIPQRVKVPGKFVSGASTVQFFYQGVMWIDQMTSAIVLLRTDLLAPLPSAHLNKLTTELHFHSVHIQGVGTTLWLPREVEITVVQGDDLLMELHRYSNYRLYHARSRIVLTP